jgi:glycosyltransferase involved in cell wall biosynthesis
VKSISATVITKNEERNISGALESLAWCDEIVIVDSGSTDATLDLCRKHTDKIFHRDWTGYVDQRNYATDRATCDWILTLDADERLTPELIREIADLRRTAPRHAGYRMPRVSYFMNRWIRHGDWYPDWQLRLFDRQRGRWQGGHIHESVRLDGSLGTLAGEIQHFSYHSLSDYVKRLEVYSTLAARDCLERGKVAGPLAILGNPLAGFLKSYILKRGFLDGIPGLMAAEMKAVYAFVKYAKLYELQRGKRAGVTSAEPARTRLP